MRRLSILQWNARRSEFSERNGHSPKIRHNPAISGRNERCHRTKSKETQTKPRFAGVA